MLIVVAYDQPMSNLIELYNEADVNRITGFATAAKRLDISGICEDYSELRSTAPLRFQRGKHYFVAGHNGIPGSGKSSNRKEEHLAIAIYNASRSGAAFELPDGRSLEIMDYQTPLKSRQRDRGIGKVDLFGVVDKNLPAVIELKVEGQNGGHSDTPLRALLEGLAYCAIVEANMPAIAEESSHKFGLSFSATRPMLIVMAPEAYWRRYLKNHSAGIWLPQLLSVIDRLKSQLELEVHLIALQGAEFDMGLGGMHPVLRGNCKFVAVEQISADV